MADEADSKSVVGNHVRVQVPPPADIKVLQIQEYGIVGLFFFGNSGTKVLLDIIAKNNKII